MSAPQPRRIALVLGPSTGGIGRHVRALAGFLTDAGVAVTTVGPAETVQRFAPPGQVEPGLGVRRVRRVSAQADVVHAHGVRAGLVAAVALLGRRTPLVVTWHNLVGLGGRAGGRAQAFVARRAAVSLCVSPDLVEHVTALGGRARLAPVGATPRVPSGRPMREVRAALGLRPEERLVLAVARLNRQKGLDVLQDAAAHLPESAVVAVAGEGPERARLGPPLRLLGAREDVADLLAAADVVVLPSRWEGSPLAAHEALLAGRPLVATAVGGVPALVGDADPPPAVLVPPEDPAALATAISGLLEDPSEAEALATRARSRGAQWPDAERTVQAVLGVYGELLGGG
jgi:glycosyltransferase involved in cell wall biosynthesis